MISDAIALVDVLKKLKQEVDLKVALFKWDGTQLRGSREIEIEIIKDKDAPTCWLYRCKLIDDHLFIRIPVNPEGVVESHGISTDGSRDADFFRWIPVPDGRI